MYLLVKHGVTETSSGSSCSSKDGHSAERIFDIQGKEARRMNDDRQDQASFHRCTITIIALFDSSDSAQAGGENLWLVQSLL